MECTLVTVADKIKVKCIAINKGARANRSVPCQAISNFPIACMSIKLLIIDEADELISLLRAG